MKKIIIILSLILLLSSIAIAQELTLGNTEYNAGETLSAYISGTTIISSQISLLDNSSNIIPISPLLVEYKDNSYFIYFNLGTSISKGSYKLVAGPLQANFSIGNGTEAIQVKPGIVILDKSKTNFKLELKNVGDATSALISSSDSALSPRKSALSFSFGESKNLFTDYNYNNIQADTMITLNYGTRTYTIPIIYPEEEEEIIIEENVTEIIEEPVSEESTIEALSFLVSSEIIETSTTADTSRAGPIKVQNNLDVPITKLKLEVSSSLKDILTLNISEIAKLGPGEVYIILGTMNKDNNSKAGIYSGDVIISNDQYSASLPMIISITEEEKENISKEIIPQPEFNFDTEPSEEEKEGNGVIIIGVILILLMIAILVVVGLKLRQKEEKRFDQYIEETKKK